MVKEQGGLNQINDEDFHTSYASFMGFMVYQIDVKSAFLYGTIEEEVYVCQYSGFEDPDYPYKVYKVVKELYGLYQALRACQDKYVAEILKKFGFTDVKSASTPIETEKPLLKGPDGEDVDVHIYRYLKGKPHLGLWYLRDSPFNLVAYSDSDYARASLDRKSITGGCQFLVNAARHFITAVSYELMLLGLLKVAAVNLMLLGQVNVVEEALETCKANRNIGLGNGNDEGGNRNGNGNGNIGGNGNGNNNENDRDARPCLSAKRTAWNEFSCSMTSAVIYLATGRKFNFFKYIFDNMVKNMDSPSNLLMYLRFLQVVLDHQKVFANIKRVGKGFLGVETPLFDSILVQPQPQAEEGVKIPIAPTPPSTTNAPSPTNLQDPTPIPHAIPPQDQPPIPPYSPPQDQPTTPHESSMPLLTTLMKTCATLSQKVAELEKDKHSQALEILQLKKRVKMLEMKKKSKTSGRMHPNKREAIDVDEGITLVDVETDEEGVSAPELVSAAEPTVFDDEDVTMTMAQTLIKLKAEKAKILDEQIAQKLHDEENMAGYKMKFFRGMTNDKIRPIFEREFKKVQTLFKPDKDVQQTKKKRVAAETLLQESFKKLRAAEVSGSESTQEIPFNDPEEMTEEDIIRVRGITEAYQNFKDMLKVFDREDLVALWNLVKEKFSSAEPSEVKEKALGVELKRLFEPDAYDVLWKLQRYMHAPLTWKLYSDCRVHHVSSTRRHDIFMLIEKDYLLSNAVMILMLSEKLRVEEDNEMVRDLVMKIFMEANKPKSTSLDTSS
nr:copia protein [Tanacetum cinerariifolium]